MNRLYPVLICLALAGSAVSPFAQTQSGLKLIGKVHTRPSREIASSSWSIGGETLDRDFTVYDNYKKYLGPLGAKAIRLDAGWAKCEKKPGVYEWSWLDEVVDDSLSQGVQPWLQLSYGNPIYAGGGDARLGGAFPSSPEALAAWDRWVRATIEHYKGRVHQWEIWNEPDGNRQGTNTVAAYIGLYIRTATIIREIQPKGTSQIYALALAGHLDYAFDFIAGMTERKKLDLIDTITIHGYPPNPDNTQNIEQLRERIAQTGQPIPVYLGETGAPSKFQEQFALSKMPWTENTQAKWDLRRMLAIHGVDAPSNLYQIMDMRYLRNGQVQMNYKGLLAAQQDPAEMTVAYAKPAYYAMQRVFSIFDNSLARIPTFQCKASVPNSLASFAYRNKKTGAAIVALWFKDSKPSDSNATTLADLTLTGVHFKHPVYIDLLTGDVYELPKPKGGSIFQQVPLYDSPILIAERTAIQIDTKAGR